MENDSVSPTRARNMARILETAASIPQDQEGPPTPAAAPPTDYWGRLWQMLVCASGRHTWSAPWRTRPLVPAHEDVSRMLDGAEWPTYEHRMCTGCLQRQSKRLA